jgi:uncharacterized protein
MASSDIAFSPTVKRLQEERGSRELYARVEEHGGFKTEVTDALREFLAQTDTAFLATASADGQPYVQHRGGPKGFIRVVDDKTLGFVDYVGNYQYITTGNLDDNDRVCLFLVDYARRRRVKVWGTARVVAATDELLAQLMPQGYRARPQQVVLVTIRAWDTNCPQHIPQKLDAADVAAAIARLEARIAELEEKNRQLEASLR